MKKLLILLAAMTAVMLCGCSLKMPQTGKGKTDSTASAAENNIVGIKTGGKENSAENRVLYDKSGVKVSLVSAAGNELTLSFQNNSDRHYEISSVYAAVNGEVFSDLRIAEEIAPGDSFERSYSLSGVSTAAMRLFLYDSERNYVEGSLSERIELAVSDKLSLQPKQLYTVIHSDENIKLGLKDVSYRDNSNTVTLSLFAENRTDNDICLYPGDIVCDHKDFRASFAFCLPAGCSGTFSMLAYTTNSTLSGADLNSISFDLLGTGIEDYLDQGTFTEKPLFSIKGLKITLPRQGRPEVSVPETMQYAGSVDEFRAELTEDTEVTELPAPLENSLLLVDDDSFQAEYLFGMEKEYNGQKVLGLVFRVQNKLQKQIRLDAVGIINGATVELSCFDSVKPMTEQYVVVSIISELYKLTPELTDAVLRFELSYDDGHYDGSSFIGSTDAFKLYYSDNYARPQEPDSSALLCEDDYCKVYLLDTQQSEEGLMLLLYAVNKSDKPITVTAKFDSDDLYIRGALPMFRNTYSLKSLEVTTFYDEQPSAEDIKGHTLLFTVQDKDSNILSSFEGTL